MGGHGMVFTGVRALVRLGYQRAAVLGAWRVDGGMLSATVDEVDGFRITQSPLVLEIPNADGLPTRRALAGVSVSGGRLTGRLLGRV